MNWHQVISYLSYWKKGQTIYDIHSPFLYDFVAFVFDKNRTYYDFQLLKEIRKMMAADKGTLAVSTVGAPSNLNSQEASIDRLLKNVATAPPISEQLYRMNVYLNSQNTLELGTCLGINSLYLAKSSAQLTTIEGHAPFYNYAHQLFRHAGVENVELQQGLFSEVLPTIQDRKFDLIYVDGHHEYRATLEYAKMLYPMLSEGGILVLADIYWSGGMQRAWNEIYSQDKFKLSLDCYHYGLLWKTGFTGPKQHFVYLPQAWMKPWKALKAI